MTRSTPGVEAQTTPDGREPVGGRGSVTPMTSMRRRTPLSWWTR